MNQIGPKTHITTTSGIAGPNRVGAGTSKAVVKKASTTPATVTSKAVVKSGFNENGIKGTTRPDGTAVMESKSGMKMETSEGGVDLKMPGAEGSFRITGEKVEVTSGDAKNVSFTENPDGLRLLHFNDKGGNHVQVHPESMTYEVLNKNRTVSQVYFPDGKQQILAMGTEKAPDGSIREYTKAANFDEKGQMTSQNGFSGMELKDGKLTFDVGSGKSTRTLPRAMPGQTGAPEGAKSSLPQATQNAAPTALLAEQPALPPGPQAPLMIEGPKTPETKEAAPKAAADPAKAAADAAKAERKQRLDNLKQVDKDFFNPNVPKEGVQFAETPSGVLKRMDGESVAFELPTGDKFRTDGELVAVLGDKPRAKNARLVEEDGRTVLAFKDKARNNYQLDVNSGDLSVSNADGSLKQKLYADGREEIHATSIHTTDAGSVKVSHHSLLLEPDGKVFQKDGFDDLKVGSKHLEYSLPNGKNTVRNLLMETKGKTEAPAPKQTPGDSWSQGQSAADLVLGKTPQAPASEQTSKAEGPQATGPMNANPFNQPPVTASGVQRESLADGSVKTTLPGGVSFVDGEKPYAMAADGSKLEVLKQEVPSEGGYILYTRGKNGVGYTIAPEHLDFIAEGKDGKVHQMVKSNGTILTSVKDGKNQHVHQLDYEARTDQGSPGVVADPATPNKLYVMDGPQARSYDLPHPFPVPPDVQANLHAQQGAQPGGNFQPGGYGPAPEGMSPPGVKPSFWDKVKGWFGGGQKTQQASNAQQAGPMPGGQYQAHHAPPSYVGGMPGNQYQYDPVADQMRQMQAMNGAMMTMNMVGMGVNMLTTLAMPAMFFPFF